MKGRGVFKWEPVHANRFVEPAGLVQLDRSGFFNFSLLSLACFSSIFGPILQPPIILLFFSLFPPFKPIFRIYSKSAK